MTQKPKSRAAARIAALTLTIMPGGWLSASASHAAALDLAGGCATAGSASLHEEDGPRAGFEAGRLELLVPGLAAASSLHAGHLRVTTQGAAGTLTPAQLEQASSAAAASLLAALSPHHDGGCPTQVLQQAVRPLAHALQAGGGADFAWSDVDIRSGSTRFGARHLSLHLVGGPTTRLAATVDGAVSNSQAAPLMPGTLALRASVPTAELPALLAGARTGAGAGATQLTIEQVHATRDDTTLDGHGQALIGPDPQASAGEGEVSVRGFDALITAAGSPGLERLHTALFLAKLVAHHSGDGESWTLSWRAGTLLVNNVPLPLR